ncbi:MAG TPA: hypothetical protein VMW71_08510 [Thermoplasmata archaeon]|nr:hypothetical protein [Thermoplasmata archaeon]
MGLESWATMFMNCDFNPEVKVAGVECERCGAMNSPNLEKCGNCGAAIPKERPQSEGSKALPDSRTRLDTLWESALSSESPDSIWNSPHETITSEQSLFSVAVNIRRIFVILLIFLAISTISMIATLYIAVSDAPSINGVIIAVGASVFVAIAGAWYALNSKRLSER